ncbi:hypothetical protein CC86DRAFT_446340 [Ophiobolus disseminans]|uniref:Extracellular membrane protein CFEM domain-containing protein n=1 Tax=Ophiobolus disseminans TaxID=1469910 RepID=A0A6A6ZXC1_9PLEO|nr:hypothetical protein CC86DRAFT_446340 [Ophiobolus disseminans]
MMFAPILKLVPALRLPSSSFQEVNHEQIAIDACIDAVQIYFPCDAITPTNHTCLCEQYTWHVTCYDNHASNPPAQPSHASTTQRLHDYCDAAGDAGAALVQHKYKRERRQLNSILNSVGGVVASFLSSQTAVGIPTAIPSIRVPSVVPLASVTPPQSIAHAPASSAQSNTATPSNAQSSPTTPTPTTLQSTTSATTPDSSHSSAQSTSSPAPATASKSSSPSPGLIAGAVIGGIAVLILLGILIMLILRHKRKNRHPPLPTYQPTTATASARSLDETLVDRTPMTENQVLASREGMVYSGNEKEVYRSSEPEVEMPRESELYTSANVWELDGRETAVPSELESPVVREARVGSGFDFGLDERASTGRRDRSELHF